MALDMALDKIFRTEPEIFASMSLQSSVPEIWIIPRDMCCDFFLVGMLTIEQKLENHNLEESSLTSLLLTLDWQPLRLRPTL
jgi:hypothetical protein